MWVYIEACSCLPLLHISFLALPLRRLVTQTMSFLSEKVFCQCIRARLDKYVLACFWFLAAWIHDDRASSTKSGERPSRSCS